MALPLLGVTSGTSLLGAGAAKGLGAQPQQGCVFWSRCLCSYKSAPMDTTSPGIHQRHVIRPPKRNPLNVCTELGVGWGGLSSLMQSSKLLEMQEKSLVEQHLSEDTCRWRDLRLFGPIPFTFLPGSKTKPNQTNLDPIKETWTRDSPSDLDATGTSRPWYPVEKLK